jgi:hypothetical protein
MDPSNVVAGINACFKFAEYARQLSEVGPENDVFIRTIQIVKNDLGEVDRLMGVGSVKAKLVATPAKSDWIKHGIHSTRIALYQIGKWVERVRVEQEADGSISFEARLRWVFNDHEKLRNRQTELSACHQQLSNFLTYLITLDEATIPRSPPLLDDVTSFDDILSPRQRMREKLKAGKAHSYTASMTGE